jgi:hypothetical protein
MAPLHRSVPHLRMLVQRGRPNAATLPFPFPPFFSSPAARAHPPLPSDPHPLRFTGAPSSSSYLATASPLTHPPSELHPRRYCLSLEPRLTFPFPSSSCRTAGTSSPATGASPPPWNVAAHRCHRPPCHRPVALVSSHPYDLARWVARLAVVLTAPTSSPGSRR